jgi:outer membrane protein assembly factor BamB
VEKYMKATCGMVTMGTVFALVCGTAAGSDWPQYRGAQGDGGSSETLKWSGGALKAVWTQPMNTGFSSFAVGGGKVFTQVVKDIGGSPREVCVALDAASGKELWSADIGAGTGYSGGGPGDGPRSTPTLNDGMVYLISPELVVFGVDAQTGKTVWKRDVMNEHAGRNIGWRSAASAVVDGELVFVAGGGSGQSLLALNKKTGAVVWKALDEKMTHATPVVATILGRRQVIFFMESGLVSVATADGKLLWRFPFRYNVSTAASPVVSDDIVFCSAGYDVGGGACRIVKEGDGFTAKELWKTPGNQEVANHWSTPVCKDGHLYGMFCFKQFKTGPMKCVEIATGKVCWTQPGFGQGNLIRVGDRLLALSDTGDLVAIEATPAAYKEVARMKAVDGKCWSTPAFSNGRAYVRSTKTGACLEAGGN